MANNTPSPGSNAPYAGPEAVAPPGAAAEGPGKTRAPANVSVRPATRADAERILAWQVAMAWETERFRLDPEVVRRGVAGVFDRPERGRYLIAQVGSQPAGCVLTLDEWSDWRNGTVMWIHSVYIDPAFRRMGVFRAVYDFLKETVEADPSLRGLRLFVDRTNENAQRTYRALGMSDEHYAMFEWMKG